MNEPLDFTPDPALAERIRAALPRHQEGDVLGWVIVDPDTGEWCMRARTRTEARFLAGKDGQIGKVVRAH